MSRKQKISCRCCGSPAIIKSTVWKTPDFADVYIACTNPDCRHQWVTNFTYSHTLTPSALQENKIAVLIDQLSPEQKKQALNILADSLKPAI